MLYILERKTLKTVLSGSDTEILNSTHPNTLRTTPSHTNMHIMTGVRAKVGHIIRKKVHTKEKSMMSAKKNVSEPKGFSIEAV